MSDDHQLEQIYLECWDDVPAGRRLHRARPADSALHVRFGADRREASARPSALASKRIRDTYTEVLAVHFEKHLRALQAGC